MKLTSVHSLMLLVGLGAALPLQAQNQSYNQIAPKPVQPQKPGAEIAPSPKPSGISGNSNEVLVHKLKALVFVPTPQAVEISGAKANGPIVFKKVTVPDETSFRSLVTPYVGQKLTRGRLNTLIDSIVIYYRQHDRPVIDVIVPEQDITGGVIQLVLLEGKVGKVTVTGTRWFSPNEIRDDISAQPGDEIRQSQMQDDLDWANNNPFHSSDMVYHPGQKLGETDIVLETRDRFPARFYAGYEDSGNAQTGFDRYLAGINWGDAFHLGLGQQLNYQYTTSGDGDSLRAHSGSYIIPLPWHHTLTFFGSYVDTKGSIPPLIGLTGRSYQISGRYDIPLPSFTKYYKHTFGFGFDYKYDKSSLEFGGVPAANTLYDVDQFVLTYSGAETDPCGQTTISDQLYISPGNWGGNNNDAAFGVAHTGATSDYVYNTLVLERLTKLPEDFTLILRGTLQTSNANLAPSEQLGFGGYDTVRGYDEREVNSDDGYIFTTELRTPSIGLGELCGWHGFNDQLQFLGFWDYGAASNHAPLPGEPNEVPLSSVGFGLRYTINTYVSVRYDYGFQLLRTGLDKDQGSRSDLGIVVSY